MIESLIDSETLLIAHDPKPSDLLVISFSGIGQREPCLAWLEFQKVLEAVAPDAAKAFVIDRQRRWFNEGLGPRILDGLNGLIAAHGYRRVVMIGNSMGGLGVIALAGRVLNCQSVLAFSPQSSVHGDHAPFEDRWDTWRDRIRHWDIPDTLPHLVPQIRYQMHFGSEDLRDCLHMARFDAARLENVALTCHAGHDHSLVANLRDLDLLNGIVAEWLADLRPD